MARWVTACYVRKLCLDQVCLESRCRLWNIFMALFRNIYTSYKHSISHLYIHIYIITVLFIQIVFPLDPFLFYSTFSLSLIYLFITSLYFFFFIFLNFVTLFSIYTHVPSIGPKDHTREFCSQAWRSPSLMKPYHACGSDLPTLIIIHSRSLFTPHLPSSFNVRRVGSLAWPTYSHMGHTRGASTANDSSSYICIYVCTRITNSIVIKWYSGGGS